MPTLATTFGCIPRVDQTHYTASLFRFAREVLYQVTPGGIQNAFRQMWVTGHVGDPQVFQRNPVVSLNQPMRELVQEVLATIADSLVLALKRKDSLFAIAAALLAAGNSALQDAQFALLNPI